MSDRRSGWSDRARIIKGVSDITADLGIINSVPNSVNKGGVESRSGVNYGAKTSYINRGINNYLGGLVVHTDNFSALQFFGEVVTGNLVMVDRLPEFTFRVQLSEDKYGEYTGFKFGSFNVIIEAGEPLIIETLDGRGKTFNPDNNGLLDKLEYDGVPVLGKNIIVKLDGVKVGALQSLNFSVNRSLAQYGDVGIESDDPAVITEGRQIITINSLTTHITDISAWNRAMSNDLVDLSVELPNGEELVLEDVLFDAGNPDDLNSDDDIKEVTNVGEAKSWKVNNFGGTA